MFCRIQRAALPAHVGAMLAAALMSAHSEPAFGQRSGEAARAARDLRVVPVIAANLQDESAGAGEDSEPLLPPTTVEGDAPEPTPPPPSEPPPAAPAPAPRDPFDSTIFDSPFFTPPTEGYRAEAATTGTLLNVPLMDTPASVQVVPQDVIEDQRALRLQDALRNVSGIQQSGSGGFGENFTVRGFDQDFVYRNGFREPREFGIFQSLANVQRVEVLKGPASVLYGRIEPGGAINVITEKPLGEASYSLFQEVGSYAFSRTWLDATGPLDENGNILYRLNVGYDGGDSFRDFVEHESALFSPVVTMNLTDRLQATVEYEYYNDDRTLDQGVVALGNRPATIPRSRFLGEPSTDFLSTDSSRLTTDLIYDLGRGWHAQYHYVYDDTDRSDFRLDSRNLDEATGELTRGISANSPFLFRSQAHALNLTGEFRTGPFGHTFLVGGDYRDTQQSDIFGFGAAPPINIFAPTYGFSPPATPFPFDISDQWSGVYFQDLIDITPRLSALVGGRHDDVEQFFGGAAQSTASYNPRYALLYRPAEFVSYYTSYVESTSAQQGFDNVDPNTVAAPETAEQFEVGMKVELLRGQMFVNLAAYELTKQNIAVPDPVNPFFVDLIGEARSRGIEFDVAGELSPAWQVIGSYAYTDTEISRDTSGNQGNRLPNAAYNTGSLWTTYDLAPRCCHSWVLGGGVFAVGDRQGDQENSFLLPGYGIANLMAQRRFCMWGAPATFQVNVDNLFDKTYYLGAQNRSSIAVGTPLQAFASLRLVY